MATTPSKLVSVRMRAEGARGEHISGAEGIYSPKGSDQAAAEYLARALSHPKGPPSKVHLTIEPLPQDKPPARLRSPKVSTLECKSPVQAEEAIKAALHAAGISGRAISAALKTIRAKSTMRGAALISAVSGRRLEPDRARGVRASMIGITSRARAALLKKLAPINARSTVHIIEALTLASKVASAKGVVAELCASDDPAYTTGYVCSKGLGYLRLENIKPLGSPAGGRVFFVKQGADAGEIIGYLEQTPVLVSSVGPVEPPLSQKACELFISRLTPK